MNTTTDREALLRKMRDGGFWKRDQRDFAAMFDRPADKPLKSFAEPAAWVGQVWLVLTVIGSIGFWSLVVRWLVK